MMYRDLEESDLFVLLDTETPDAFRKVNGSHALRTMYKLPDGTWMPYGRGEKIYMNADAPVRRVRCTLLDE